MEQVYRRLLRDDAPVALPPRVDTPSALIAKGR
jgi:hypothetical protein